MHKFREVALHSPTMTDYSKWDKFAADQSDSDDEVSKPAVRVVGDKETVKIGPGGYKIESELPVHHTTVSTSGTIERALNLDENKLTVNGSKGDGYYWRQDRQEVILTIVLPTEVRGKDLSLTFNSATKQLRIATIQGTDILLNLLRYGIDTESMSVISNKDKSLLTLDPSDWEVKALPFDSSSDQTTLVETRILELSLRKVSPLPGAVFWWRNCFEGEAEIDVTKIAGRPGIASQQDQLKEDPFAIAQRMFLEKMKTREKVEVDLSEP